MRRRGAARRGGKAALLLLCLGALAWTDPPATGAAGGDPAPERGRSAPDFTLRDLENQPVRLSDLKGRKAVLINFWATWCVPCREEMPTLERLNRERAVRLAVLGVSLDTVVPARVRAFARELGLSFPVLRDPGHAVARVYRVRALPMSFIIDREGIVRHREVGYRDWTDAESQALIDGVLTSP